MTKTVDAKITMILQEDVSGQLLNLVNNFGGDDFDQYDLSAYKQVSLVPSYLFYQ